ncbi:MAG TPA: hypothetical protein VH643_39085 [Gemmataceae bacterium]|jgi:hypothetical protein
MFTKLRDVLSGSRRWRAWLPAAVLAMLVTGSTTRAQLDLPDINPSKIIRPSDLHLDKIVPPDLDKLDPSAALRRELDAARKDAMKGLRKLDPEEVFQRIQKAIQTRIAAEVRKSGVKYDARTGVADLRGTQMGKILTHWLESFAQGNKRAGRVEELSFNVKTHRLAARLYVKHCQSWGKVIPGQGEVELYSVTQRAIFHYDFRKGAGDFDIDLGPLAPRINTRTIEKLQEGDLVGIAEALALEAVGKLWNHEEKDEYLQRVNQYRARYGAANVYFASKTFVNWATPETIGKYVLNGVVTGGASVYPQIMHDAEARAREELPALTEWLKTRGMANAESAARQLLTGRAPRWPFLKFEMLPVRYSSREKPLHAVTTPWRNVNHLAFAIVWSDGAKAQAEGSQTNAGGSNTHGAEARTIHVSFTNGTAHSVSFHLNGGKGLTTALRAGQRQSFRMIVDPGRPPIVSVTRRDGRRHSVPVHDGGTYTFRMERGEIHVASR